MPDVTLIYGETTQTIKAQKGDILGHVIARTDLPLEQPCAGRGTCGLCKVLVEEGVSDPDDVELHHLSPGEVRLNHRLACHARVHGDAHVVLTPVVVYTNKAFKSSDRYKKERDVPLGLAIDLGSTTVGAYLTMLDNGEVCRGAAALNQQTAYGADIISRLTIAVRQPEDRQRLHRLAVASINQAVDALKLSESIRQRIEHVTIVCNVAMHHLLADLPLESIALLPFQPHASETISEAGDLLAGIFPDHAEVVLPPLVGGFVGSDALACLAYFGFDHASGPMAAIDLGTNGEVMVTDGQRILTASTAAGPAFEGVNISCGSRAVDGAITKAYVIDSSLTFDTIADEAPIGLTGSGLLSLVYELLKAGVIEPSGRIAATPDVLAERIDKGAHGGARQITLTSDGALKLTQWDIRELQKAKGAIRAALDILLEELNLSPTDLERVILTGSFGGVVDIDAILRLGMLPPVRREIVETVANGAGLGAAIFLTEEGLAQGEKLAKKAKQIDLDQVPDFARAYITAMRFSNR
jgi:uncharacterized 2Fe-2S/4Fe-4S cluster protein (DUF4445 family)